MYSIQSERAASQNLKFFAGNVGPPRMALVSVNVLFFEPLDDCAGMAASCEILAQSVVPSIWSAGSTQPGPKDLFERKSFSKLENCLEDHPI